MILFQLFRCRPSQEHQSIVHGEMRTNVCVCVCVYVSGLCQRWEAGADSQYQDALTKTPAKISAKDENKKALPDAKKNEARDENDKALLDK